jgi:uncharacterized membrane protein YbhN (UPF0104 family)
LLRFLCSPGIRVTGKVAVSAGLLYWLIQRVQDSEPSMPLAGAGWGTLALVWLMQSTLPVVQAERWRIVAAAMGARVAFFAAVRNVYVGQFFNQVLPSSLGGDAVRAWQLRWVMPLQTALASVGFDRVVALLAVPVIVTAGSGILLRHEPPAALGWTLLAAMVAVGCGFVLLLWGDRIPLPVAVCGRRLVGDLRSVPAAARRFFGHPGALARALLLSVLIHAGVATSVWMLALAYSADAPLTAFVVLVPLITMATAVPVSIGGWGVREGAAVALLGLVDIPPAAALAISIQFGLVMMVVALPGGVLALLSAARPSPPGGAQRGVGAMPKPVG